jgi:hypothetical protein
MLLNLKDRYYRYEYFFPPFIVQAVDHTHPGGQE